MFSKVWLDKNDFAPFFRLMDANQDGLLNFREVVQLCDVLAKGDHSSKMRLLYCLHLPGMVLPGELDSDDNNGGSADEQVLSQILPSHSGVSEGRPKGAWAPPIFGTNYNKGVFYKLTIKVCINCS